MLHASERQTHTTSYNYNSMTSTFSPPENLSAAQSPKQDVSRTASQQQLLDFTDSVLPETWILLLLPSAADGVVAIRFLISPAIVMNASSTLVTFFAEVSRKGMFTSPAKAWQPPYLPAVS